MCHRIVVTRHGGPEVLRVVEDDLPAPGVGEVRIRVLAAGVAMPDVLIREGTYPGAPPLPLTPGYDLVGVVDALGAGDVPVRLGQTVAALTVTGAYTGYICLPAPELVPVPADLDPAKAVSVVLNYTTAYQMLYRVARVRAGERVLVHGAAGGVGTAALQLGRLAGLEMYGTASAAKAPVITRLGGIPIDYTRENVVARLRELTGGGVDVVLDGIGGTTALCSYRALRADGRLVLYGHYATLAHGRRSRRAVARFYAIGASVLVAGLLPWGPQVRLYQIARLKQRRPDWFRQDLRALFDLLAQDRIAPVVALRLPLAEARRAHELLGQAALSGKIVLICDARE